MALHHGLNTRGFRSYAELKAHIPSTQDGVYALFPYGSKGPASISHCITYGGEYYQAIFTQCGGPQYSTFGTNVANSTLHSNLSTYDGIIQPFSVDGQMYSRVNKTGYDYWTNQPGTKWYKATRSYDSSGTYLSAYSQDVTLTLDSNITFANIWNSAASTELPGYVTMELNGSSYGSTKYTACYSTWSSTRGFANAQNGDDACVPTGESKMNGSHARHVLSYVHTSAGYNATRCQPTCWGGSENVAMEQIWYVKFDSE